MLSRSMGLLIVSETPVIPNSVRSLVEPYCCRERQVEGCAAFLRWVANTPEARDAGDGTIVIHRSVPQLIRGMGLPTGPTVRAIQKRWTSQVKRWIRYLEPLGISYETAPAGPGGRGTGILIRIPAGVAQSVRAAES